MATAIPANQCRFSASEIAAAIGALRSPHEVDVSGVSIDTRTITPGALFVALRGVRDGHEFITSAADAGAVAAIVERGRGQAGILCFEVDDTLAALGALARFHLARTRAARPFPVLAIGGAAGKTTTKEITAALMRALYEEVLATPGNLNNQIGVPMTIFTLTDSHRAAVLECGTNRVGEIPRLAKVVNPDVALVLNVDIEHTEGLGSLEGVADEEAALFSSARTAVVSIDEALLRARIPAGMRTITFGARKGADVCMIRREPAGPGRQKLTFNLPPSISTTIEFEADQHLIGAASANNSAAALAAVAAASKRPWSSRELDQIRTALASVRPVEGRLSTQTIRDIVVIDDSYNANPRSVRAALEAARESADSLKARLVVALGDMLELGSLSAEMHQASIVDIMACRPDAVVVVGPEMRAAVAATRANMHIEAAGDSEDAAAIVRRIVRAGDVLLVKGSRGIAMERIIKGLAES